MYHSTLSEDLSSAAPAVASLNTLADKAFRPRAIDGTDYRRVRAVGSIGDGTDWRANGAALRRALACTVASAADPCLLTLARGVYDLGAAPLHLKAYVDIEGTGEQATRLTSDVCSSHSGTIVGADHAMLRRLTVANTGGGAFAVAIYNDAVAPQLTRVTAEASGGLANYGVYNANAAAPVMIHMRIIASGRRCNIGVYNDGAAPVMTHVSATVAGGYISYGIYNRDGAAPVMTHVSATAAGGDRNFGVYNDQDTWPTMTGVTARALGGIDNIDVYND
jgi:hypothetical protein